ncbi:NTP transferase domain-containing protein [Gordonia sp. SID5947]|uniref:glucose-1-phosphate adenylyltransferase family protein n=1 Tax=Gordonia sp. SID5947 TaxID=2690315 RepID=UPI0013711A13|nr:sugar phosphate nucleotidyltransferase [Gordonia sp. SID5947]MYR05461.1 NTP transferase domain-containing protein [Gordonia sp. SID5947]
MDTSGVVAIVAAGGRGSRMEVLTDRRAKPALPFGGNYQLIDFPLSNLHHSRIDEVWLCVQYQADSLLEQIAGGRPWDLDRTRGGLRIVLPEESREEETEDGFATGNADLLYRIRDRIVERAPEAVVVMSADHVYEFDLRDALAKHRDTGSECTVVTTTCSREEASEHATVHARRDGTVTGFRYKPDRPTTRVIAAEIFVYDPEVLVEGLETLFATTAHRADDDGDTGLGDFGDHLIPWFVARGKTMAHALPGYWIDAGRPETYLQAHRDLIDGTVDLFRPDWPILTHQPQRNASRIDAGATVADSMLSSGAQVSGTVRRSVLGPGVVVERGATVTDSIIFADSVIRSGAHVAWSILDERVRVGSGAIVGGRPRTRPVPTDRITLVGMDSLITARSRVPLGARIAPGRRHS